MSVRAMQIVWQWPFGGNRKVVALALADEANDNGISYPSQQLLARKCRLSPRRLRDHLQALEDEGYLERERRSRPNGSRTSDVYRLILDGGRAPP